jgi:hypothetical protein
LEVSPNGQGLLSGEILIMQSRADRIHHAVRYDPLGVDTRKGLWDSFLRTATTARGLSVYTGEELDRLAGIVLNGRQVRFLYHEGNLIR